MLNNVHLPYIVIGGAEFPYLGGRATLKKNLKYSPWPRTLMLEIFSSCFYVNPIYGEPLNVNLHWNIAKFPGFWLSTKLIVWQCEYYCDYVTTSSSLCDFNQLEGATLVNNVWNKCVFIACLSKSLLCAALSSWHYQRISVMHFWLILTFIRQ
jgi:hypothetical protein